MFSANTSSMMTKFFFGAALFLAVLAQLVGAAPVMHEMKRDVFVPPVTYPHAGTVWYVGQVHNVTWDTSNAPVNITNREGRIQLRQGDSTLPQVLAEGFDILNGRQEITVPSVPTGSDYAIVLFGDSGNFSPEFTINA